MIHPAKIIEALTPSEHRIWRDFHQAQTEYKTRERKFQTTQIIGDLIRNVLDLLETEDEIRSNDLIQASKEYLRRTRREIRNIRDNIPDTEYNLGRTQGNLYDTFTQEQINLLNKAQHLVDTINQTIED